MDTTADIPLQMEPLPVNKESTPEEEILEVMEPDPKREMPPYCL